MYYYRRKLRMKRIDTNFNWIVTNFDCNKQKIEKYNILRYREEDIKKLKKKYTVKEEFEKELRTKKEIENCGIIHKKRYKII